jgi:hypothetical protein
MKKKSCVGSKVSRRLFFKQTGVGLASMAFCSQISVDSIVDAAVPRVGQLSDTDCPRESIVLHNIFPTCDENVSSDCDDMGVIIYWSDAERENGTYVRLNGTGSVIWQLCDGKNSIWQIVEKLAQIYDVPEKMCKDPVISFVDHLFREGYIIYSANMGR